jgi:hypothetical protein
MSVVAAYHIFVCAWFVVQGGMWTAVHAPPCTLARKYTHSLMMTCNVLSKHVGAAKLF